MKSRRLNLLFGILALTVVYVAFTSREHMLSPPIKPPPFNYGDNALRSIRDPQGGIAELKRALEAEHKYQEDMKAYEKQQGNMDSKNVNSGTASEGEGPSGSESSKVVNKNGTFVKKGEDNTAAVEPGCVFVSSSSISLDACKSACLSDPACTNINYHVPSGGCQFRRCNNPSDPVGSKYSGWNMYAFIASNPMDPTGAMTSFAAKMKGIGEVASEGGSSAFSSASELLGSTASSFGYILTVVAIIVIGVIIAAFAWKMFMGSSSASMINSAPTIIRR